VTIYQTLITAVPVEKETQHTASTTAHMKIAEEYAVGLTYPVRRDLGISINLIITLYCPIKPSLNPCIGWTYLFTHPMTHATHVGLAT